MSVYSKSYIQNFVMLEGLTHGSHWDSTSSHVGISHPNHHMDSSITRIGLCMDQVGSVLAKTETEPCTELWFSSSLRIVLYHWVGLNLQFSSWVGYWFTHIILFLFRLKI